MQLCPEHFLPFYGRYNISRLTVERVVNTLDTNRQVTDTDNVITARHKGIKVLYFIIFYCEKRYYL